MERDTSYRDQMKERERKAKALRAARALTLDAVLEKVKKLTAADLPMIALAFVREMTHEGKSALYKRHPGWEAKDKTGYRDYDKDMAKRIAEMTETETSRLLVELALLHDTGVWVYDSTDTKAVALNAAAERYGVTPVKPATVAAKKKSPVKSKPVKKPKKAKAAA